MSGKISAACQFTSIHAAWEDVYAMDCVFGLLLLVVTLFLYFVGKERRLVGTPRNHSLKSPRRFQGTKRLFSYLFKTNTASAA